jgi:hypothetical protein
MSDYQKYVTHDRTTLIIHSWIISCAVIRDNSCAHISIRNVIFMLFTCKLCDHSMHSTLKDTILFIDTWFRANLKRVTERNELQRIKWADSTSSQGHSCILMRNKEINTYNADERKYQIYWLKTVYNKQYYQKYVNLGM